MITVFTATQVRNNCKFIYDNIDIFVKRFFPEHVKYLEDSVGIFPALGYSPKLEKDVLYVQLHWVDDDYEDVVEEFILNLDDYNEWRKELESGE